MTSEKRGLLTGSIVGCMAAFVNWDGNIIVALGSIGSGAFIGYAIGLFIGKRR